MNTSHLSTKNHDLKRVLTFYQEGTLAADAWFRIAAKDYLELIHEFDFHGFFSSLPKPIELLDVGCGTGKFPELLREQLPPTMQIIYDYLDPSAYSLSEMKKVLERPYQARHAINATLEAAQDAAPNGYDVIWSVQSACYLRHDILDQTISKLSRLITRKNGVAFIYLFSRNSFYQDVYDIYNEQFNRQAQLSFLTIEPICEMVASLGIPHHIKKVQFHHSVPSAEHDLLEHYLKKCVLEATPLSEWRKNETLWHFLQSFNDGTMYHFPQNVWLLMFSPDALKVEASKEYIRNRDGMDI